MKTIKLIMPAIILFYLAISANFADFSVVKDGKPACEIVVTSSVLEVEKYAAEELQYHIKLISGAVIPIVNNISSNSTNRIYICSAIKLSNIKHYIKLNNNDYSIISNSNSLLLYGEDSSGESLDYSTSAGTLFAVYDLLENQLGIHWLWPGESGITYSKSKEIIIKDINKVVKQQLIQKVWRKKELKDYSYETTGYSNENDYRKFCKDRNIWLRRQRFYRNSAMSYGHSFTEYWSRFAESSPQYFAQLPTGDSRPYLKKPKNPETLAMCVSQPQLWNQIISDWKTKSKKEYLNICENDTNGMCICPNCMAWDILDPALAIDWNKRLDYIMSLDEYTRDKTKKWVPFLGQLSDRYAKFADNIYQLAKIERPDVKVIMYAYENYKNPPLKTKLNENILIGMVPPVIFPYNEPQSKNCRSFYDGWLNTGGKIFLRPNFTLSGHCFPIYYADTLGNDLTYFMKNKLIGVDFDSMTGQFAAQGPTLYMLARKLNNPELPNNIILNEYYKAFGAAENNIRAYFSLWYSYTNKLTTEQAQKLKQKKSEFGLSYWGAFFIAAPDLFPADIFQKSLKLLNDAKEQVKNDREYRSRVDLLIQGLIHSNLVYDVETAYEKSVKSKDSKDFKIEYNALMEFRKTIQDKPVSDISHLTLYEQKVWSKSL
jgi:hypothetical protein